eukprot:15430112-Alexandrium_andersonii.AAC.1
MPLPDLEPQAWIEFARDSGRRWHALVAKHRKDICAEVGAAFYARRGDCPGRGNAPDTVSSQDAPRLHWCDACPKNFKSARALVMHNVRCHQHVSQVGIRVCSEWCPACLVYLHTQRRVMRHVALSSPACRLAILANLEPVASNPYEDFIATTGRP